MFAATRFSFRKVLAQVLGGEVELDLLNKLVANNLSLHVPCTGSGWRSRTRSAWRGSPSSPGTAEPWGRIGTDNSNSDRNSNSTSNRNSNNNNNNTNNNNSNNSNTSSNNIIIQGQRSLGEDRNWVVRRGAAFCYLV